MSSDLIERLRDITKSNYLKPHDKVQIHKAADALETKDAEIEQLTAEHEEWMRKERIVRNRLFDENAKLQAVVDAVDYLYECWHESGDSADWGNALPNLFEKRAALEGGDE